MISDLSCRLKRCACLVAGLLISRSAWAQNSSPCDLGQYGVVNSADVTLAVNMALGAAPCTAKIEGSGICSVVTRTTCH
jgi:hypothetical protein